MLPAAGTAVRPPTTLLIETTSVPALNVAVTEWLDRYGPLPPEAEALIEVARLRVEAARAGLDEVVLVRDEIRMSPASLKASQEVRLERLAPGAMARDTKVFVPTAGLSFPGPGKHIPSAVRKLIAELWPDS